MPQHLPPVAPLFRGQFQRGACRLLAVWPIFEHRYGGQPDHDPAEPRSAAIDFQTGLAFTQGGVSTQQYSDHEPVNGGNGQDSNEGYQQPFHPISPRPFQH